MALFGKKKKKQDEELEKEEIAAAEIAGTEETPDPEDMQFDSEDVEAAEEKPELTPEEQFKKDCANLARCLRLVFPQQMLIGYFYAELQSGGYIDDFCCYDLRGRLLERQEIPALCKMSLPEMVSREENLEQAFFDFRRSAEATSGKPCNAVSVMMLNDGQVKLDVTATELVDGQEEQRYAAWRKRVEMGKPRPKRNYEPPKMTQEQLEAIQKDSNELYRELGTEFFSFLPDAEYKIAYFYAEFGEERNESGESRVFFYHRLITNDGEIIDNELMFEKYEMDKEEAAKNRIEIVKYIMQLREVFVKHGQKPFSSIHLSCSDKGEFQSQMGFGPTDLAGEKQRVEEWKKTHME